MFTLREITTRFTHPIFLLSWGVATLLASLAGAFGSSDYLGWPWIVLFWGVILAAAFFLALVSELTFRIENFRWGFWQLTVTGALFFAFVTASSIMVITVTLVPAVTLENYPIFSTLLTNYTLYVAISIIKKRLFSPAPSKPKSVFLKRLNPELGREILRISSMDHYIEVVTKNGSELILMRLADAMSELTGFEGAQVHRSHWVAKAAIIRVERSSPKMILHLRDGSEVPVSRSYRAAIQVSGLLDAVGEASRS